MTAIESGMTATESGMTATESGMTKQRLGCQLNLSLRPGIVIAGLTRNPVHAYHWIPDQDAMDASLPRGDKHERVERQEHEQPSFRKRDFE